MRRVPITLAVLLLGAGSAGMLGPLHTAAQGGAAVPGDAADAAGDSAAWTGAHIVAVRWLHARQRPDLTPFPPSRLEIRIDSMASSPDRYYLLRVDGDERRGTLRIGADGALLEAWIAPPDLTDVLRFPGPRRRTMQFAGRRLAPNGAALLDDTRLWDLAPLKSPPLRAGAKTRDTLRFRVERFGFLQSLEGPRVTTLIRDTVVEGRRLWVGRDSARVRYRERLLQWRRSLDTLVVVERTATGTLRGRFLYDPDLGLFRARSDTLTGAGETTLRQPDGTAYRTPASYERRVDWTLRSPAEQRAWEEEERARRRRGGMSMVLVPSTPLEQRIAGGDTAAADSLLGAWAEADLEERHRIREALAFAPGPFRDRLDSVQVAAGGWIRRVGEMTRRVRAGPPLDSAEMVEYLKLLRDPSLAFEYGMGLDPAYENLAGGLVMRPPVLDAPPERTSCTPAACRLVAAEGSAREPRLRKVALVARFVLEPERWVDSLLSRPDTASHLLHPAVLLARGVGATWESAEKRPIPPPGASWREWRRWTGVEPVPGAARSRSGLVRFEDSHRYAIRMTERLTGRDIGAELAAAADTTAGDSARALFRVLALQLGAITPTLAEIIPDLRSSDASDRQLAFTALHRLARDRRPADPALAQEVVAELLAQVIDGDSIWTAAPQGQLPRPVGGTAQGGDSIPLFIERQSLPAAVRISWEGREDITLITREAWQARPPRAPGRLLVVGEPTTLGPLVWVSLARWVRQERAPDESPRAWASGEEYLLLRTGDGWVVLATPRWIT